MNRRALLATVGGGAIGASAGCVLLGEGRDEVETTDGSSPDQNANDDGATLDVSFELTEAEVASNEPPVVNAPTGSRVGQSGIDMNIEGTVTYGSNCATLDLAYAEYHSGPEQLSILVAPANPPDMPDGCYAIAKESGYQIDATLDGPDIDLTTVVVTEHHVLGETYSTTVDFY